MLTLDDIRDAAVFLQGRCRRTETIPTEYFSDRVDIPLFFKCENLQRTGSFKIRGALNFLAHTPPENLSRGVVTASAGNHAQGVALAGRQQGVKVTVVMPENTPLAKIQATKGYGAEVLLHGYNYDDAAVRAGELAEGGGMTYVPAFDHPLIMAGQGTIGLEILEDHPDVETIVVPIGGGGLIAGIATAVKSINPRIRIVGVEAAQAPSVLLSLKKGEPVTLTRAHSLADGIVIKRVGNLTFPVIRDLVDEVVTVEEEEIALAIVGLMEKRKLVVEGAGAVGLAAVLGRGKKIAVGKTVIVLSGGNIDVQTISRVVERGMVAEGRYLKVRAELPDVPGTLAALAADLAGLGANILHISHDRHSSALHLEGAEVRLELETKGPEHIGRILDHLAEKGYGAEVVT